MGNNNQLTKEQLMQQFGQYVRNELSTGKTIEEISVSLQNLGLDKKQVDVLTSYTKSVNHLELDEMLSKRISAVKRKQSSAGASIGLAGRLLKRIAVVQFIACLAPLGYFLVDTTDPKNAAENMRLLLMVVGGIVLFLMVISSAFLLEAGSNLDSAEDDLCG